MFNNEFKKRYIKLFIGTLCRVNFRYFLKKINIFIFCIIMSYVGCAYAYLEAKDAELKPGLIAEFFDFIQQQDIRTFPVIKDRKPDFKIVVEKIDFSLTSRAPFPGIELYENFVVHFTGLLNIDKDGEYTFYLTSDDGSLLRINDKVIVDNDGVRPMRTREGKIYLTRGKHNIKIEYFESFGDAGLRLSWKKPGTKIEDTIPASVFFHHYSEDIDYKKKLSQPQDIKFSRDISILDKFSPEKSGLKHADVCLSLRWSRPGDAQTIAYWNPTRLEWTYSTDLNWARMIKGLNMTLSGALNTVDNVDSAMESIDLEGNRVVAPWMTEFLCRPGGPSWFCVNRPATIESQYKKLEIYIDNMGADVIQHDDWLTNYQVYRWAKGCFCNDCMIGFRDFLRDNFTLQELAAMGITDINTFNYKNFLKKLGVTSNESYRQDVWGRNALDRHFRKFQALSSRKYHLQLREFVKNRWPTKKIAWSINATYRWDLSNLFLLDMVDYLLGEFSLTRFRYDELVDLAKTAEALGIPQIISPHSKLEIQVNEVRELLALSYAMGQHMLIPWDIWISGLDPRWSGSFEEYGDLFKFIRTNSDLFDDFEPIAKVGICVEPNRRDIHSLMQLRKRGYLSRFIISGRASDFIHIPLDDRDFDGLSAIVVRQEINNLPTIDQTRFHQNTANLLVTDSVLEISEKLLPHYEISKPNISLFARRHKDRGDVVLHLVNRNREKDQLTPTGTFVLKLRKFINPLKITKIEYYQPGKEPIALRFSAEKSSLTVTIPELNLWGIIKLSE